MDFGSVRECSLTIRGKTPLPVNTITVRVRNETGEDTAEAVDFTAEREEQSFRISVPGGRCTVTFVFLPGSSFDFDMFRFAPLI